MKTEKKTVKEEANRQPVSATIVVMPEKGATYIGSEDQIPNVATFFLDGVRYDVAIGKAVAVPVALAEDLKRKGKIDSFTLNF